MSFGVKTSEEQQLRVNPVEIQSVDIASQTTGKLKINLSEIYINIW